MEEDFGNISKGLRGELGEIYQNILRTEEKELKKQEESLKSIMI